ncbi:acetolactate synthase large subunit [Aquabacter spiritensis]|uniref:Acetolactate synthase-1/2/3 large subunit n=1 Tax=Aquabacter spiritensis TaxID=933073 RepID=A0A4R3LK41_9HYPH|nr:acetolactate synthase large subunit [Aquabacter spiritensis]TCT00603.1 acetolactate synthase-1/2/3 large subunit [Aquabacter spiritensis]
MNGADRLCDALLVNGVDVCFANPGTSEMHFVAALDRKPQMRCVLGLFEGVVTGAADGYARMADKPAATLLHLGPGLANGLANLHNARRARTPMINVVGDHASYHLALDAPLTSDIESLARPMSHWVGRAAGPDDVAPVCGAAYAAAMSHPGVSTLILPADAAWSAAHDTPLAPTQVPQPAPIADTALAAAVAALKSGRKAALLLAGKALRVDALAAAGRIAAATGVTLFSQVSGRSERGAGRVYARPVPYPIDMAIATLADLEVVVLVGGRVPVGFFAYPGKPGVLLPEGCEVVELATHANDLSAALEALAEALGAKAPPVTSGWTARDLPAPTGALTPDAISIAVARALPEGAILCDEALTSGGRYPMLAPIMAPHDHLPITGGAIGIGIPLSAGAAVAAPGRKVVNLQADGSGMYTVQGLWTQARENLDVVTIVFSNRAYAILQGEMRNVGVNTFGRNASRMLTLSDPDLDWVSLARGMGVEAARATTIEGFADLFDAALRRTGPFLIEAVL